MDIDTNMDMTHSFSAIDALWTAPTTVRRSRPAKPITRVQLRIESIIMGLLAADTADRDAWRCINGAWFQGLRMEDLAAITGYTAAQCRPVMQRLVAAGVVQRTGNTRGTRYTAVGL